MIKFENVETFGWEATIRGMRNHIHSIESQVVMDNVYVVERCSLDAPSLGECTLAGKKYYVAYTTWIPIDYCGCISCCGCNGVGNACAYF